VDACRRSWSSPWPPTPGANRVGGEVGRLERAERLSYLLEARAYEQAALASRATSSGALDEATARRAAAVRQELTAALAELAALHPDDPAVPRVRAAAVDWQATLDTKQALLAAGDLVAANRVDNAQVDPGFERLAALLRTTAADYSRAASAAQGRSKAGALAVVVAATLLSLACSGGSSGPGRGSGRPSSGPRRRSSWPPGPTPTWS
jgi:hypothetical protein